MDAVFRLQIPAQQGRHLTHCNAGAGASLLNALEGNQQWWAPGVVSLSAGCVWTRAVAVQAERVVGQSSELL